MRCRRLFALLTSMATLHLTVASAGATCATHGATDHDASAATGHAMPMQDHEMPNTHAASASVEHAERAAVSDTLPCEIPVQQNCCEALVGCSVACTITSALQVHASRALPTARVREALHDAPASFAAAPEPPPPKA